MITINKELFLATVKNEKNIDLNEIAVDNIKNLFNIKEFLCYNNYENLKRKRQSTLRFLETRFNVDYIESKSKHKRVGTIPNYRPEIDKSCFLKS
jgi:hypothetical protein